MAATGLSQAVTSTLELLAGYSYLPSELQQDPAYAGLQSLDAAEALITERNLLRKKLTEVSAELKVEREQARVYAGFLQELMQRVQALPRAAELLAGIQQPKQQTMSGALCELLEDYSSLLKEVTTSAEDTEAEANLAVINAYLDRTLLKSETSLSLLSRLELSKEPIVLSAWRTVKADLNEKLQRQPSSLMEEITLKVKALNALKSVEVGSLEEAWSNARLVKTTVEDFLVESEGWVITEAHHSRVEITEPLKARIHRRIELISAPWTVESLSELSSIHSEYEFLRNTAVLKPWSDQVRMEYSWWDLVHRCTQLSAKSEQTLALITKQPSTDLQRAMDTLQPKVSPDPEGTFLYLEGMLELLVKAEDTKAKLLVASRTATEGYSPADLSSSKPAQDFCGEFLNLAMIVSTIADEPIHEMLQLSTHMARDRDVSSVLPRLKETAEYLRQVACVKIEKMVALNWAEKLLVRCAGLYPEGHDRRRQIQEILSSIRRDSQETEGHYIERRDLLVGYISEAFSYLQTYLRELENSEFQQDSHQGDLQSQQEQLSALQQRAKADKETRQAQEVLLQSLHSGLDSGVTDLEVVFTDLQSSAAPVIRAWALSSQQEARKLAAYPEKLRFLVGCVKGLAGQVPFVVAAPKPVPTALPEQVLAALEKDTNGLIRTAMTLLEAAGKPALLTSGNTLLETRCDPVAPVAVFAAKFDYVSSVCIETKTLLMAKSAEPEELTLTRKLKDLIDQVHRNALDLAKASSSPANEQQMRKKVQDQASVLARNCTSLKLAELLAEAVGLERQQVDLRVGEDFQQAESCEAALIPKTPMAGGSSPPTSLEKVSTGLRYLLQSTKSLEKDWEVTLDETQAAKRLAQIEANTGYQKILLEQAYLHWRLSAIKSDIDHKVQALTATTLTVLDKRVKSMQDGPQTAELQTAMEKVRSEQSVKVSFTQLSAALTLLESAIPNAGFKVSAFQGVLEAVENLMGVYEQELTKHAVKLDISRDEESQMTQGNKQARASALLAAMERGAKLLSGMIPPQDKVLTPLQTKLYQIVQTISRPQAESLLQTSFAGPMQAVVGMIDSLQDLSGKIYDRLVKVNSPTVHQDICAYVEMLISLSKLDSETASVDTHGEELLSQVRTPLTGFPPRANVYTPIDSAASEALKSAVAAYDAIGLAELAAVGREHLQIRSSQGDPQGILLNKLEFLKDSLNAMRTDYMRVANQSFGALLVQSKQSLLTASRLLKNTAESQRVQEDLRQAKAREEQGEVKDSLQQVQNSLTRVINQLALDYGTDYQVSGSETRQASALDPGKKLSAVPSTSEKVTKGLEYLRTLADALAAITGTEVSSELYAQIQALDSVQGQEKLHLEESILYSQLKAVHAVLRSYIFELIPALKNSLRLASNKLVNRVDIEVALLDIEAETSTVPTLRELVLTLDDQITTLTST